MFHYEKLFAQKTIDIKVMEQKETNIILTGTTKRLSWYRRLWHNERINIMVVIFFLCTLSITIGIILGIESISNATNNATNSDFYLITKMLVPAQFALFLNYSVQVAKAFLHNEQQIYWDLSILNKSTC